MDLQAKINEKFAELIQDGYVDKIVKDALQSTVKDIISTSVRTYSTFGKELEKHIEEGMAVNLSRLSLSHYNDIILGIVQEELNNTAYAAAQEGIKERIGKVLGRLEKTNWKLSEIISRFKESIHVPTVDEMGLHVEESKYGGWYIYFDEEGTEDGGLYSSSRKEKHHSKFDYRLYLDKDGKVFSFSIEGGHPDFTKATNLGFDAFFFKLYASGAVIEVDEDECELSYEEEYD